MRRAVPRRWLWGAVLCSLAIAIDATGQPYGLEAPVPVGAFLDGALPALTPLGPANSTWDVDDAFPALPLVDTLVIAVNPAETDPASDRLYVGSRGGVIVSFPNDPTATSADPFLDLSDRVAEVWDGGFLGLAFHPDFGVPGSPFERRFYVYYSSHCPLDAGLTSVDLANCDPAYPRNSTGGFFGVYLRLSSYEVFDAQAPVLVGDPASEEPLLNIRLYNGSHRGGGPVFGHDGLLYLAIGDQFRYDTAQRIDDNLEGGSLRLAVDVTFPSGSLACPANSHPPILKMQSVTGNPDEMSGRHYCIPDDNPWPAPAGSTFEEYWSIGHRNPHRIAVDSASGRLWSGEVGESTREEVNVLARGGNFGWPFREGLTSGPRSAPAVILGTLTDPVIDFDRSEANAIIGGYVYHGSQFPELAGRYITGDYVTANVWALTLDVASMTATKDLLTTFDPGSLGTFGQDGQGEILLGSVSGTVPLQTLVRLSAPPVDAPAWLSQLGAFTNLVDLTPAPFLVPFEPVAFWSDGAQKQRWAAVPNDGTHDQASEQIGFDPEGPWDFPNGTVLVKQFDLGVDDTDPGATTRLETRFLVRGDDAEWYGLAYRWLEDGTDAYLLEGGETRVVDIATEGGGTRQQTWEFPSRLECGSCHWRRPGGGPLGPTTHGLNRPSVYPATGRTDNQLRTWNHLGMFTPTLAEAEIPNLPAAPTLEDVTTPLQDRARSWLDSNCASCHQPITGNRAVFDARFTTPIESQGFVYGPVMHDLGVPGAHVITPGDPSTSIALQRAAAIGPDAMPPLFKSLVHPLGVDVFYEWILRIDPAFAQIGVAYEYFEINGLTALPDFNAEVPLAIGIVDTFDISGYQRTDHFAFRFNAWVDVPATGDWTFYTSSDDGSQLFIDQVLVVDNDGLHANQERSGTVTGLTAGIHEIEVSFFERTGQQILDVSWQGPGVPKTQIPAGRLYVQPPVPLVNAPPSIAAIPALRSASAQHAIIAVDVSDPDGDLLYVEAAGLPPGTAWNAAAGQIEGAPELGSDGVYPITVGVSDGPAAASTQFVWTLVPPQCSNGIDDDGDGRVDFDGGGVGLPDPQCGGNPARNAERRFNSPCGLGPELAPLLAGLTLLRRRRRAGRDQAIVFHG